MAISGKMGIWNTVLRIYGDLRYQWHFIHRQGPHHLSRPVMAATARWLSPGKYVAAGGPDGGDGGKGGSIILQVDDNMSTLMDFRYKRKYVAPNGMDGMGGRRSGKDGARLIRVPLGTLVRDAETNEIIKDMSGSEPFVLCQGRPGRLGQHALCHPHPAGAPLCQGGSARREPRRDCWS